MTSMRMVMISAATLVAANVAAGEKKVELKDLPPAVQAAIQVQTKDLQEFEVSEEDKDGKTFYEVESKANGMSRDVLIDGAGVVVEVEEEIDPSRLPAAARQAVEGVAGAGAIRKVEAVTRDGATEYEVVVKGAGKKSKIVVTGDGTIRKQ